MSAPETVIAEPSASEPSVGGTPVVVETPSGAGNWRDSLSVDIRENPTLANIESVQALANEHINVQKLIGGEKIARPQEDWNEDQLNDFYTQLGRPTKVEDYDLGEVAAPEGMPWSDEFQSEMLGVMHGAGLSSAQAQKILGGYIESVGGQFADAGRDSEQARAAGIQDLRNEWGKSFDANIDLAKRAFMAGAGEGFDTLSELEMADGGRLGDNPGIIRAFAALGGKMNEHGLVGHKTQSAMTPESAGNERNKLMSDQNFLDAYLNESHLEHDAAVKRINDLTNAQVG
jgi:hypothetical protein